MDHLIARLKFNAGVTKGILSTVPLVAKVAAPGIVESVLKVIAEMEAIANELEQIKNGDAK